MGRYLVIQGTDRLPSGYQEVEYLVATGTQYITTNFIPTSDNIEINYKSAVSTTGENLIFGISEDIGSYALNVNEYSTSNLFVRLLGVSKNVAATDFTVKHTFKLYNNSVYYDGTIYTTITPTLSMSSNTSVLSIFTRTGSASSCYKGKIYSFSYKEDDETVLDLVPCKRTSDSVAGMYDLVNDYFYENSGTGTFTVGDDVEAISYIPTATRAFIADVNSLDRTVTFINNGNKYQVDSVKTGGGVYAPTIRPTSTGKYFRYWCENLSSPVQISFPYVPTSDKSLYAYYVDGLPSEYQEVEYLTSTGTQYIDTGLTVNDNITKIDTTYTTSRTSGTSIKAILFGVSGNSSHDCYLDYFENNTTYGIRWDSNSRISNTIDVAETPVHSTLEITDSGSSRTLVYTVNDDSITSTYSKPTYQETEQTFYLFADHSGSDAIYFTSCNLKTFQVWSGDTTIRQFIPCYKKEGSIPGLYDIIYGVFYENEGTGSFTVGPDVN